MHEFCIVIHPFVACRGRLTIFIVVYDVALSQRIFDGNRVEIDLLDP